MKAKLTKTNIKSAVGGIGHLFSTVACLGALILTCSSASAQNLFAVGVDPTTGGFNGSIEEFTPSGVRSIFASGLTSPFALAFDSGGNLFVADAGSGAVYKFTPAGVRTTFALGLSVTVGLAFDSAGNLFAAEF
jgi:DNA-binding beta-propeller fold protein YncE